MRGLPGRPLLTQRWEDVVFLHWRYRPPEVQQLLPRGVRVDVFDGSAWVGLVPFQMVDLRPVGLPALPQHRRFVEVNVRTYVRDVHDRPAVWFFSLDVPVPDVVALARGSIGAPYCLARASGRTEESRCGYAVERRWPTRPRTGGRLEIEAGDAGETDDPLASFLTARWAALTSWRGRILRSPVTHEPWPLAVAEVRGLAQDLVQAAGFVDPAGRPLAHYSPGVTATFSAPRLAATA